MTLSMPLTYVSHALAVMQAKLHVLTGPSCTAAALCAALMGQMQGRLQTAAAVHVHKQGLQEQKQMSTSACSLQHVVI